MIEFYISNKEIILPDDFSFTHIEENPLITSNGEFTLDITVSLLVSENVIAFSHINRLNNSTIENDFDAYMRDNGKHTNGKVVIISHTDVDVKFQFVAGNSLLNYKLKSDSRKIWELNWGTASAITHQVALDSVTAPSWEKNFVCAPIKIGEQIINHFLVDNQENSYNIINVFYNISTQIPLVSSFYTLATAIAAVPSGIRKTAFVLDFYKDSKTLVRYQFNDADITTWLTVANWIERSPIYIMQPYLLYYLNRLPQLLGYELTENVLNEDERAQIMYLTNSVHSLNFADALPDISIAEFIEYVEVFFNVNFLLNKTTNSMSIVSIGSSITAKKKVLLTDVLDHYERNLNIDSKSLRFDFTRLGFDLPGNVYYKYQQLSDEMLKKLQILEFDNFTLLLTYLENTSDLGDKFFLYRDNEKNNDYFVLKYRGSVTLIDFYMHRVIWSNGGRTSGYDVCLFNKLKSYGEDNTLDLKLNIYPAVITTAVFQTVYTSGGTSTFTRLFQLPICSTNFYTPESVGFIAEVENGIQNAPRKNKLEVALYSGRIALYNELGSNSNATLYPFSHIDYYPEFRSDANNWFALKFQPAITKSLRIVGENSIFSDYTFQNILDTTKEYEFVVIDTPDMDPNNLFEYENQIYMPIKFERIKENNQSTVKCYFYRLL